MNKSSYDSISRAPTGSPSAMASPVILVFFVNHLRSKLYYFESLAITPRDLVAKASFISKISISFSCIFTLLSALFMAGTGTITLIEGSTPP